MRSLHDYAVTRDAQFVFIREADEDVTELRVVLGWFDELRGRVSATQR